MRAIALNQPVVHARIGRSGHEDGVVDEIVEPAKRVVVPRDTEIGNWDDIAGVPEERLEMITFV